MSFEYLWETTAQGEAKLARLNAEARELASALVSVGPTSPEGEALYEDYHVLCSQASRIEAGLASAVTPGRWSL